MDDSEIKRERDFLHEILNKMLVAQGRVKINVLKLQAGQELPKEEIIKNLEKSLKAIDNIVTATNSHRLSIIEDDDFIPDPEINFDED